MGKYALDFVRENGVWKIWEMRFSSYFMTKFDPSWTEAPVYDYAFFPVTPDRPRETPVYHCDGAAVCPDDRPPRSGLPGNALKQNYPVRPTIVGRTGCQSVEKR